MKAAYAFLFTWIFFLPAYAQSLEWTSTFGSTSSDHGQAITVDSLGNTYATGTFRGKVDFEPGPDTFFLTATANNPAVYVVKLTKYNELVWAATLGIGIGYDISLDHAGYIDITGTFTGSSDFDSSADTTTLTSNGAEDIFICQFSTDGEFQWALGFGGPESDVVHSMDIDVDDNIYTTGSFRNTVDFDPGPGTEMRTSSGETDVFIQKISHAGIHLWTRKFGDMFFDNGAAVKVDHVGHVVLVGNFHGIVDFDPDSGTTELIADDSLDVFVCVLNGAGFLEWANHFGGVDDVIASDVTVDHLNNIFITGYFKNTADFNPAVLVYSHLTSLGGTDIFLNKLDANGNFQWVKRLGGTGLQDKVNAIQLDKDENIYLAGSFTTNIDVDPNATSHVLISSGSVDLFLTKLNPAAAFLSAHQIGGKSMDVANDVAIDLDEKAYLIGTFTDSADFSPGRDTLLIKSKGGEDAFIVKLNFNPYISDIQGPLSPCADDTVTYSINAENVNQFAWTFPSSWQVVGSSNNDTVQVITTSAGGSITVSATGENGTTFPLLLSVDPVAQPVVTTLLGKFAPCPGELITYSVQTTDLESITWTFPAGWQIVGNAHQDTVQVIAGNTNGVVLVTGSNSCGDSSVQRNLFPQKLPVVSNIVGDLTPCVGDTIIYRAQQTSVNHNEWTIPAGWELISNEDSVAIRVVVNSQSGKIVTKGLNICGETTFTADVDPFDVPDATILVNNNILSINPPAQSYQWFFNSVGIPNAIQNSFTATESGSYYAKVTFASGCVRFTAPVNIIITSVHVDNDEASLRIYPMPAKDKIIISGFVDEFHFWIYDLTGRQLFSGNTFNQAVGINQLVSGTYLLQVEKDGVSKVGRFVKE